MLLKVSNLPVIEALTLLGRDFSGDSRHFPQQLYLLLTV